MRSCKACIGEFASFGESDGKNLDVSGPHLFSYLHCIKHCFCGAVTFKKKGNDH